MTRIILIGFMGAGKTTLGRALSKDLGLQFIDLDAYIEMRYHKTVSQLFDEFKEEGFRKIEQRMLHEVSEIEDVIIAAGGGTPCFFDNMDYMNEKADTVYLKATPKVLLERLSIAKSKRPLLKDLTEKEMEQYIEEQLLRREPYYSRAKKVFISDYLENKQQIYQSVSQFKEQLNLLS